MRKYVMLAMIPLVLASAGSAWAVDSAVPPSPAPQKSSVPHADEIIAMAKELAKELDKPQALALADIRNAFGVIHAITIVRGDVSMAIGACENKNPDMAQTMDREESEWQKAIDPLLLRQQKMLDGAVDKVNFPDRKKVKSYLSLIEQSADKANEILDKRVVTTPEACRGLIDTMKKTQPALVKALSDIKWPEDKTQGRVPAKDDKSGPPQDGKKAY